MTCVSIFFHGASLGCKEDTIQNALKALVCAFQLRHPAPPLVEVSWCTDLAGASLALACAYLANMNGSNFLTLPCGIPSDTTCCRNS
eukprot:4541517-Pleurochrysis_carterae.AAC.1